MTLKEPDIRSTLTYHVGRDLGVNNHLQLFGSIGRIKSLL